VAAFSGDLAFINLINGIAIGGQRLSRTARRERPLAQAMASRILAERSGVRALWPLVAVGLAVLLAPVAAAPDATKSTAIVIAQADATKPATADKAKDTASAKAKEKNKAKPAAKDAAKRDAKTDKKATSEKTAPEKAKSAKPKPEDAKAQA
jgi:hypothetical protein